MLEKRSSSDVTRRHPGYFAWVVIGYLALAVIATLGILIEFQKIDQSMDMLARERGSALFRLIELARDWNAQHGGVYVPVTSQTQPNPYLEHPKRDLETLDGTRLTMVNPAFMTRQMAEIAERAEGVKYHITSLRPIRPANAADPWEGEALAAFETTKLREKLSLIETGAEPVHRYMAPLLVKEPCLACHASQGYQLGQVRGGISVTMSAVQALLIRDSQRQRVLQSYSLSALAIAMLMHLVMHRSRRHLRRLQEISNNQERLIDERTRDLSAANARLQDEILEREHKEAQIRESETRYRSVIETSQNAIFVLQGAEYEVMLVNDQAARLLGLPIEKILNHPYIDFIHPSDHDMVAERLARHAAGQPVAATARYHFCGPLSSRVRVGDVHVAEIRRLDAPVQWVVSVKDVTDELSAERALKIAASVMENATEGIVVTDEQNRIIQVNPAFSVITGFRPQEVMGKNPQLLASGHHDNAFFADMWETLQARGSWAGEVWNRRPDGTVYVIWLAISLIRSEALESGGRHVATFIDITRRKEAEEVLRHKAQSDPLTDLPNRTLFLDRLQVELNQARRYAESFALLYVDLDHFKAVNDRMGHAAGDALLVQVAHRLLLAVRDSDTVARFGGDEFAVILPKVIGEHEVIEVIQRIVQSLAQPFALEAGEARVSGSVGVALYPQHGQDTETLCAHADAALYVVKQGGRNGYRFYSPTMNPETGYGLMLRR